MLGQFYAHEAVMEGSPSNSHSLGHLHFQAKEIIYNVNKYFIAEKVKKELSNTENLKYAYDLATLLTVWQRSN